MSSLTLFEIICTIISLQITNLLSQHTKSVQLTPNTISSIPNISINLGPGASIIANLWSIDVTSQQGTDLHIHLDPTWGFHPTYPSSIELFIHGNTSNETLHHDGEIFFIFTTANQYFAELISIDIPKFAYKECPLTNTPLITRNISQMIHAPLPDRYFRFCNNSIHTQDNHGIDYWENTGGSAYRHTAKWPIFIEIKNDPILHTLDYAYGDFAPPIGPKLSSHYTSSFPTNQGLNIHISGESAGEDFNIFSIDITYSYQETSAPSLSPIITPTHTPSIPSTLIPTHIPSSSAPTTINPSIAPSITPSVSPVTASPTTLTPSIQPSMIPSVSPTSLQPTTIVPTSVSMSPSLYPSYLPTFYPSRMPSMSTSSEAPLEVTVTHIVTSTSNAVNDSIIVLDDDDDGVKEVQWSVRLLYIVCVIVLALICVCFVVLFVALMKQREQKSVVCAKEYEQYDGVDNGTMCNNELYTGNGGNNTDISGRCKVINNSVDFSRNISSAVTGDDESDNGVVVDIRRERGRTFNNNLVSVAVGNDMMMNDVINEMETQGGDFASDSDELLDTMNDEEYYKSGYEIGMVNISKMSEIVTQSKTSRSIINDSLIIEGNQQNDDGVYEVEECEELLDEMETAGFIDGDYNELEYDDEYYEDQDD